MAQPLLSPRNLLIGVLAVAALYAWWVSSQYQRLNALNQRELAATAAELKTTIETAIGSIKLFDPGSGGSTPACDFDDDQPYLEMVSTVSKCADEKTKWINPRVAPGVEVQVQADREGKDKTAEPVTFRFRTDVLFSELAFTERFDRVFVVDSNGKVVYQEDPGRQHRLRLMRWAERRFRDARAGETRGLAVLTMDDLIGKDAVPGWPRLRAVSDRTTTTFAGTRYQLYSHPIAIEGGAGTNLVLVGVAPVSTVLRQALAFDTSLVAVLVFLALMTALGFPFVKLAMLHSHERFRMLDVRMQYVSCSALIVVFAFAVLAADGYARWRHAADDGLRQIADDMRKGMLREIQQTRDVLVKFDRRAALLNPGPRCDPKMTPLDDWFNEPGPPAKLGFDRDDELYLDQVTWLGPDGVQIWKITSDRLGKKKIDVSGRAYYRAVRDSGLFELKGGPAFFVGPERSITDGKFYSFVSIRSTLTDHPCTQDPDAGDEHPNAGPNPYVAVATVHLLSIDRRPLPAGYGFAVIARDGRVLYHSDGRLSLRDNFFDELTSWADARSVVYAGNWAVLGTRYRERPHRVYLQPLGINERRQAAELEPDQVGLYIATFRDMSMEQSVISRAFLISLAGPFAFLIAIIVPGLWLTGRLSKRLHGSRNHWLWPQGAFEPLYQRLAITFAAIHLGCLVLALLGVGVWSYVALPLLTIGSGLYVYARDTSHRVPRRRLTRPVWFMAYFSLLALNTLVVPAVSMFDTTLRHEFGILLSTEQRWMGDQIEDAHLEREAEARAERIPVPVAVVRRAQAQRERKLEDWPAPFNVKGESFQQSATLRLISAHERLDRWLPFDSEAAVRFRYQKGDQQYSPPGLYGAPIGLVGVCGLLLLAAGFLVWLRWMSTRLLFASVASRPELHPLLARAVFERCSETERHLLMQISEEGIANPRQRSLVVGLMEKGLVRLNPDLQLSSPTIRDHVSSLLAGKAAKEALSAWENPHNGRNWHDGRNLLLVSLAVVALIVAAQPGLPSELAAVATGVATTGAAGLKVRDVFLEWLSKGRKV